MVFRQYHSPVNLSTRERQLLTTLVVLLIVLASFQLLADVTEALSRVADVVIIFIAAWAVSYLLSPLVTRIDQRTILNRALSVVVVYIGIAFVLAGTLALVVPGLVSQLNDLIVRAPGYGDRAAREVVNLQRRLEGAGVPVSVTDLYGQVPAKLSLIAGTIAADALQYVSATASVLFNATLVLIIAFIMLIDGDQLWRRFIGALTPELRSEAELLRQSADRSFGGFIAMPVAGVINTFVRYAFQVAQGRRARTEASTLMEESDAAAAAAAADLRDAEAEARESQRTARKARLAPRGK